MSDARLHFKDIIIVWVESRLIAIYSIENSEDVINMGY